MTADKQLLSRERVAFIRAQLEQEANGESAACTPAAEAVAIPVEATPRPQPPVPTVTVSPPPTPEPDAQPQPELSIRRKARVATEPTPEPSLLASLNGERVRLLTHVIPDAQGHVCVQSINTDGPHQTVPASHLTLIGFGHG